MSASLGRSNLRQVLEAGENMVGLSIIFSTVSIHVNHTVDQKWPVF